MRITGIDHVVLLVTDIDRMIDFYTVVLGCQVEHSQDDIGLVHLRAGTSLIDLVDRAGTLGARSPDDAGPGRNLDHICLRVEAFDPDAVRAELAVHGIECDPSAQRFGSTGQGHSLYLWDVEGNGIELRA
ncbi:VOC family protein [Sphingobium boeckii]|uniref:Catechol 2,3-dioxygenase-like lactoylglutathione lyase family enzyme n=1 Tax=Sphingobium boeckii TaxID=1082345 RepID=A0A7W9ALI8_9SPHN|nr:VOC family protein [Sphingobium boeckii]MBB5687877.1 catechol 2,3-dioxygenase-like lactoylglutathione lyase family enzyme [Sphingobium boeckii]